MKRLLLITHSFPPLLEARSIQTLKLVRHLRDCGWEPTVLTVDPSCVPIACDNALSDLVPGNVRVVRTRAFETQLAISALARLWPALLALPDKQIGWLPWAKSAAARLVAEAPFDLVLTNAKPFTCHLLGRWLKIRFGLPWAAYFSDPWVDNPYFPRKADWQVARNRSMERQVLEEADGLIFNNPETAQLMVGDTRKDASVYIQPHAYDPGCFDAAPLQTVLSKGATGVKRIAHTGNFYGIRSPLPLVEAFTGNVPGSELHLVGKIDRQHRDAFTRLGPLSDVHVHDSVGYIESLGVMREADVLVNVDAPVDTGSVFFPSKVVDYLGAGRPIVGITPAGSTTERILKETGHHVADVRDVVSIRRALRAALARTEAIIVPAHYSAPNVTTELATFFERLASPGALRCAS